MLVITLFVQSLFLHLTLQAVRWLVQEPVSPRLAKGKSPVSHWSALLLFTFFSFLFFFFFISAPILACEIIIIIIIIIIYMYLQKKKQYRGMMLCLHMQNIQKFSILLPRYHEKH